jgi:hypothetical protein
MRWKLEPTKEFDEWWKTLSAADREEVSASAHYLEQLGPGGGRPLIDSVKASRHPNMKELRATRTIRVFFAFDPRRVAVLLIGGDKAGKTKRFYGQMVAKADKIYNEHLRGLGEEASRNGR